MKCHRLGEFMNGRSASVITKCPDWTWRDRTINCTQSVGAFTLSYMRIFLQNLNKQGLQQHVGQLTCTCTCVGRFLALPDVEHCTFSWYFCLPFMVHVLRAVPLLRLEYWDGKKWSKVPVCLAFMGNGNFSQALGKKESNFIRSKLATMLLISL